MKPILKIRIPLTPIMFIMTVFFSLSLISATPAYAHKSPSDCTGSGLQVGLYVDNPSVHIGDSISFSVKIFMSPNGNGQIICDASNITASLITPDGQTHPVALLRTALSSGQSDLYPNIATYVVRSADVKSDGTLTASVIETGDIHQNDTDSQGGGTQGVNMIVITVPIVKATLHVIKEVVNTGGGTATPSFFNMHVKLLGEDVVGSPIAGAPAPGTPYLLLPGTYVVGENPDSTYTQTFSGNCDSTGTVVLAQADDKICTVTNTYIPTVIVPIVPVVTPVVIATPVTSNSSGGGSYSSGYGNNSYLKAVTTATIAPVIVSTPVTVFTPSFPDTGYAPDNYDAPWSRNFFALASLISFISVSLTIFFTCKRKHQ